MNPLGLFRRFYSTGAAPPKAASSALVSSTPRAVRIRRQRFPESLSEAKEDSALSDVEQTTYNRLKARGELTVEEPDGLRELTEEEWLERTNAKRRRVRGAKQASPSSETENTYLEEAQVVGQRIYLPNIIFRLVRNHTPPGEPYNPFEATFRIPQSITKLDIRGYLLSMYGVRTTYIRTDNRMADIRRGKASNKVGRLKSALDTYKRAVVGLEEPFYFPQTREDMDETERNARKSHLDSKFQVEEAKRIMGEFKSRAFRELQYRNKGGEVNLRGKIIRRVMEQRVAREGAVASAVEDMLADTTTAELPTVRMT